MNGIVMLMKQIIGNSPRLALIGVLSLSIHGICAQETQTCAEVYARRAMSRSDTNQDGVLSREDGENVWKRHQKLDLNQDGIITVAEYPQKEIVYLDTGGQRKLDIFFKQTSNESLHLDIYYPAEKRAKYPVVLYTHGGGWGGGNKQAAAKGVQAPCLKRLLDEGFCVVATNYRLVNPKGSSYVSDCVEDCKDALRYLAKNSEALMLDPNLFFTFGDSAGGHLAQMVLLTPRDAQLGDKALADAKYTMVAGVSWYGFTNLEHNEKGHPMAGTKGRVVKPGMSPEEEVAILREMSPSTWLTKHSPRLLLLQGDDDTAVNVGHAYYMQKKAKEMKASIDIVIVKNGRHNWKTSEPPFTPDYDSIVEKSVSFLVDSLKAVSKN